MSLQEFSEPVQDVMLYSENLSCSQIEEEYVEQKVWEVSSERIPRLLSQRIHQSSQSGNEPVFSSASDYQEEQLTFENVFTLLKQDQPLYYLGNVKFIKYHTMVLSLVLSYFIVQIVLECMLILNVQQYRIMTNQSILRIVYLVGKLISDSYLGVNIAQQIKTLISYLNPEGELYNHLLRYQYDDSYNLLQETNQESLIETMKERQGFSQILVYMWVYADSSYKKIMTRLTSQQLVNILVLFGIFQDLEMTEIYGGKVYFLEQDIFQTLIILSMLPSLLLALIFSLSCTLCIVILSAAVVWSVVQGILLVGYLLILCTKQKCSSYKQKRRLTSFREQLQQTTFEKIENTSDECCPICLQNYQKVDIVTVIPCQVPTQYGSPIDHYFHKDCIDLWLNEQGSCPICRKRFIDQ